jgi:flagellar motor component MotA
MYRPELFRRATCSRKAKTAVLSIIDELVLVSESMRRDGINGLESEVEGVSDTFAREMLRMVADSVEPAFVQSFGLTYIESARKSGVKLLKDMVVLEGVVSIARRESPNLLWHRLRAYLGEVMFHAQYPVNPDGTL